MDSLVSPLERVRGLPRSGHVPPRARIPSNQGPEAVSAALGLCKAENEQSILCKAKHLLLNTNHTRIGLASTRFFRSLEFLDPWSEVRILSREFVLDNPRPAAHQTAHRQPHSRGLPGVSRSITASGTFAFKNHLGKRPRASTNTRLKVETLRFAQGSKWSEHQRWTWLKRAQMSEPRAQPPLISPVY